MIDQSMGAAAGFFNRPVPWEHGVSAYGIPVGWLVVRGLEPRRDPGLLAAARDAFLRALLASTLDAVLAEPRLAGYRALHAAIGKHGRQFVPAPESHLRILFKRRAWRSLGPLIDCYNLVALQTRVSIGAHDLTRVRLPVALVVTTGGELLQAIGEAAPLRLTRGEYAYRDASGALLGRLECRQSAHSCVTAGTRDVLFILQGHASLGGAEIIAAADSLMQALQRYYGPWQAAELSLTD